MAPQALSQTLSLPKGAKSKGSCRPPTLHRHETHVPVTGSDAMTALPLETKHLLLRDFEEDDWEAVHAYGSDPEVVRYVPWGPNSEQDTKDFLARVIAAQSAEPRQAYDLAVTLRDGGNLIGGAGLHLRGPDSPTAYAGYVLNRQHWGQGYGTEALGALLALGFERLGLHRIFATCDTDNVGSFRVMEKNGMRREGHFLQEVWQKGEWRDRYLYAILEDEWRAQQQR